MNYHWNIPEATRKYHYYRGLRAGLVLAVIVSALTLIITNAWIS